MASELPVSISKLKAPDKDAVKAQVEEHTNVVKEMVRIYQEAYKNDRCIQLKYIVPELMLKLGDTISNRVKEPSALFLVARDERSKQVVGWLALAYKLSERKELSEEHVLLIQYALLPDIVAKGKSRGIAADLMLHLTHLLLIKFKDAREEQLVDNHCILSTLVVDPEYQNRGVASALLSTAIRLTEVYAFPIWVQAPEVCQGFFERHLFEVVGEYQLDLNEHVPKHVPKAKGKGKAKDVDTFEKYVWRYMVRMEPLESAVQAYRSSKVFAEQQAAQEEEKAHLEEEAHLGEEKEPAGGKGLVGWIKSKAFPDEEAKVEPKKAPGKKGKQPASEEEPRDSPPAKKKHSTSGEGAKHSLPGKGEQATSEEEPENLPLGKGKQSTSKNILVAKSDAGEGPSTPLLTKSRSKGNAGEGPSTPLLTKSSSKGGRKYGAT